MLTYQSNHRIYKVKMSLTLDLETDLKNASSKIKMLRNQLSHIDENPQCFPMENNGASEVYKKSDRPPTTDLIQLIASTFKDSDLAGFWSSGPLRHASINSKGQSHYFESDPFFFRLFPLRRTARG